MKLRLLLVVLPMLGLIYLGCSSTDENQEQPQSTEASPNIPADQAAEVAAPPAESPIINDPALQATEPQHEALPGVTSEPVPKPAVKHHSKPMKEKKVKKAANKKKKPSAKAAKKKSGKKKKKNV